jgi:hypothetical protein
MRWKVGVLRPSSENVDWTTYGETEPWEAALHTAHRELKALVAREGIRQEYRLDLDGVPVIVWPGLDQHTRVQAPRLDELPVAWPGEISCRGEG